MIRSAVLYCVALCSIWAACQQCFAQVYIKPGQYVNADAEYLERFSGLLVDQPGQTSFYSNGTLSFDLSVSKALQYRMLIIAWGSSATTSIGEIKPTMTLSIDNKEICRWSVPASAALCVSLPFHLKPGQHKAGIAFINDYSDTSTGADVNLFVKGFAYTASSQTTDVILDGRRAADYSQILQALPSVLANNISKASRQEIPAYYPPVKNTTYNPSTIPDSQIKVRMKNGKLLALADISNIQSLDGVWKCSGLTTSVDPYQDDQSLPECAKPDFDDGKWDDIRVPMNWYDKYTSARQFEKPYIKGWYRKAIDIPESRRGGCVVLHFGVIGYQANMYVNGQYVGSHHGDFTPWDIDITRFVRYGDRNTLAIEVLSDFAINKPVKHVYGSQWAIDNIKGGIWQNTQIRFLPQIYISRMLITPRLADSTIRIDYVIINNSAQARKLGLSAAVQSAMLADRSEPPASHLGPITLQPGKNNGSAVIKLKNPKFWSPEAPYLYHAVLTLSEDDKVVSGQAQRFGYRELKAVGPCFYLNGKRIYLFGENLASVGYSGVGENKQMEYRNIAKTLLGFKQRGYVILRTPHMPIVPEVLEIADEVGMMIFDEWGWAFSNSLDQQVFESVNLTEFAEWIHRDYNHPSVVMWSCGNEVSYGGRPFIYDQMNKQVALAHELDISGRPASSFSGAAADYGTEKLATDVLDLHSYIGLGAPEWTKMNERLSDVIKTDTQTYGVGGKLQMPFVVWECVGFSWGGLSDPTFRAGDVDAYTRYAAMKTSWGEPNGIGFAGTIGLAAALDPNRGCIYGQRTLGKRILEQIRYCEGIQGFAPWFLNPGLDAATLWNQKTLCGLRGTENDGVTLRHPFTGRSYTEHLFIVNSCNTSFTNLKLIVFIVDSRGKQQTIASETIRSLAAWQKLEKPLKIALPAKTAPGKYQLRLKLTNASAMVSQNFYNIYVQSPDVVTEAVKTKLKTAMLAPRDELGKAFAGILKNLGIQVQQISDTNALDVFDVIIVPPALSRHPLIDSYKDYQRIEQWIESGGVLLALEQNYNGSVWFGGTLTYATNTLADMVVPQHPAFKNLTQDELDTWDHVQYGRCVKYVISPFTANALAARGPMLGESLTYNAIAEGSIGKGRVILSQLSATEAWDKDSAASTYMRNLLEYALSGKPSNTVRKWVSSKEEIHLDQHQVIMVDLRAYTNRAFEDRAADDGVGGWTDQGENNFKGVAVGIQKSNGVPFDIIDPATNDQKACIILKGSRRPAFPAKVEGIKAGFAAKHLFFLHALAWGESLGKTAQYIVHYKDGTVETIPLVEGVNIADWFANSVLPAAEPGIGTLNPAGYNVKMWQYTWKNPKPAIPIESIDFVSEGTGPVPILLAITAEPSDDKQNSGDDAP